MTVGSVVYGHPMFTLNDIKEQLRAEMPHLRTHWSRRSGSGEVAFSDRDFHFLCWDSSLITPIRWLQT